MDQGLVIGYDLCDDHCRISYYVDQHGEPADLAFSDEENPYLIHNSICKKKGGDTWLVGEEAYETALLGSGQIVDKLLRLVSMGGSATFEGVSYTAEELLFHFLDETLKILYEDRGTSEVAMLVFTMQELNTSVMDAVIRCVKRLGIDRKKVRIISHTESFLFYVMSRPRDLWTNISVLFDLSDECLSYYEMNVQRGQQPNAVRAYRASLKEGFKPNIIETEAGRRMADNIMTQCVERMLSKKQISSVFLSGRGMDNCQRWGVEFLKKLCYRRRVFFIENLFAKGAVYEAADLLREKTMYPYMILCEGRIGVVITMDLWQGGAVKTLRLSESGSSWYESKEEFDIIPDNEPALILKVRKAGERSPQNVEVPLTAFSGFENRKTRIGVTVQFTSENTFEVTLKDKGFGEFRRATDIVTKHEYRIDTAVRSMDGEA
ncbi:MAG: hypothetical protein IJL78_08005 [Lachnospiraceae bacterium]|nr:hypothetical protein [Lachnospiraceae bacterium]